MDASEGVDKVRSSIQPFLRRCPMIDSRSESLFTLTEVPEHVPKARGRRIHTSTIWRWTKRGIRGVKLETIRIGGRTYTSTEALSRFFLVLSQADPRPTP